MDPRIASGVPAAIPHAEETVPVRKSRSAESIVAERPRDKLDSILAHRLNGNAFEAGVARFGGEIRANSVERVVHRSFIDEIQLDAADVALVTNVRRQHLKHHRKSDSCRGLRRVISRRGGFRHDDWQPERMQNPLALDFRENRQPTRTSRRNYR